MARQVSEVLRIAEANGGAMFEGNGRKADRLAKAVTAAVPEGWGWVRTAPTTAPKPFTSSKVVILSIYREGDEPQLWGWPVRQD